MIHNEYVKQVTSTSYHIARIVEQELDVVGGSYQLHPTCHSRIRSKWYFVTHQDICEQDLNVSAMATTVVVDLLYI